MDKSNSEKREKNIDRVAEIVKVVLMTDTKVYPKWKDRISEMEASGSKEARAEMGEAYARAVAEKIINDWDIEI